MQGDFGQVKVYNDYFPYDKELNISTTPSECIINKLNYAVSIKGKTIPIMIGSDIHLNNHPNDNPVNVLGYFIVEGICKTIYNLKINYVYPVKVNMAIMPDNTEIHIEKMGEYYRCPRYSEKPTTAINKWDIPHNYMDIKKYCSKEWCSKIMMHLSFIKSQYGVSNNICRDELSLRILAELFEAWLSRKTRYPSNWRLKTPGEIINNTITNNSSPTIVIDFMKTNTWIVNNSTYNLSENMDHNNYIGDLESVRRVSYMAQKERLPIEQRIVKENDKYIICPVQYPSGSKAGSILYLCNNAKIETMDLNSTDSSTYSIAFMNGIWKENISSCYKYKSLLYSMTIENKQTDVYMCATNIGFPIKSESNDIVSLATTSIPYFTHNPAIRATFGSAMLKQAISRPIANRIIHLLSGGKILHNGDKGEVGVHKDYIYGNNILVGIMCWYKWNLEDAIVISESCANKFKSTNYKIYSRIGFTLLTDPKVRNNQVLDNTLLAIGLIDGVKEEIIANIDGHFGHIDEFNYNSSTKTLFIRIKYVHNVEIGDKFASRHGQKGVVSNILPDSKMPFIKINGNIKPLELLINPHAFPSRMTMGQLKEMGNDLRYVYIPTTSVKEPYLTCKNKILVGPCYYMALKHQVSSKMQYRFNGFTDIITNQPKRQDGGEIKDGGLRLGTMEHYILFATKQLSLLKELRDSDRYSCVICSNCGMINTKVVVICCANQSLINKVVNKSLLIVVALLRSLSLDLRWKITENKYKICVIENDIIPITNTLAFGIDDVLDIRKKDNIIYLPICLRSLELNKLYSLKSADAISIYKVHKKLLCGKHGIYHKLLEGHRLNRSLRSVIVPNPTLDIDTVLIPKESYIGCVYGIINRQPSLSLTSMRLVKLVQGDNNCIQINPLICGLFNADFDGDEMNIYGIQHKENIITSSVAFKMSAIPTQDYIFSTYYGIESCELFGLTATKEHSKMMITAKSKGNEINLNLMYDKLGDIYANKKIMLHCNENYNDGLSIDSWYIQSMSSREAAISIAINTPYTGALYEKVMDTII